MQDISVQSNGAKSTKLGLLSSIKQIKKNYFDTRQTLNVTEIFIHFGKEKEEVEEEEAAQTVSSPLLAAPIAKK